MKGKIATLQCPIQVSMNAILRTICLTFLVFIGFCLPTKAQFHYIEPGFDGGFCFVQGLRFNYGGTLSYIYHKSEKNAFGLQVSYSKFSKDIFDYYYASSEEYDIHPRQRFYGTPLAGIIYRRYSTETFYWQTLLGVGIWHETFSASRSGTSQPPVDIDSDIRYPYFKFSPSYGLVSRGQKRVVSHYQFGVAAYWFMPPFQKYGTFSSTSRASATFRPMGVNLALTMGLVFGIKVH